MKRLVLICSLLTTGICSAQKFTREQFFLKRGLFDIQSGISLPVRDFALSDYSLPAGYAKRGYHIKAGISYDVTPYLGFALQYQYTENPYNNEKLLADIRANETYWHTNSFYSGPWKLQGVLLGLYYPFKTTKTTIDVRVMGGFLAGVYPESVQNVTVPSLNNQNLNLKQFETSAANFGFQAGFKIRYQLYKQLLISSSIDYLQTKLTFENIRVMDTYTNTGFTIDDYTQQFQIFNFSLGLGIQFD